MIKRFLLIVLVVLFSSSSVMALSQDQAELYSSGVYYFDSTPGFSCSVDLVGGDNIEQAFNFFVGNGLSATQAAGIVGNFQWESSVDPTKVNGGGDSTTPPGPDKAWGIAQWLGGRQTDLVDYADQNNQNVDELGTQLSFSWSEWQGSYSDSLAALKATTTVTDSTTLVYNKYEGLEGSKDPTLPKRIPLAQGILDKYGGDAGGGGTCSGQDTKFIDGFTVYSQYDPAWASNTYGTSTIAASGCGPSAMAMAITALTGQRITPAVTAKYADSQNLYVPGEGSSWSISKVLAEHWKLTATPIHPDVNKITQVLESGGLVVTAGQGSVPFTSGGHFIVIRGVTSDGKWKVGDSAHPEANTQSWDPQQIINSMSDGSGYAITK